MSSKLFRWKHLIPDDKHESKFTEYALFQVGRVGVVSQRPAFRIQSSSKPEREKETRERVNKKGLERQREVGQPCRYSISVWD